MNDAIAELCSKYPNIQYAYEQNKKEYICRVIIDKDKEVIDCYGSGQSKYDAQVQASYRMLGLLKLLFPMVPLTFFSQTVAIKCKFTRIEYLTVSQRKPLEVFYFPELKSNFYIHANLKNKSYCVIHNTNQDNTNIIKPECPLHLLNDPIRFSDWSQGPIISAQEAYLSKRLEDYYFSS